MPGAPPQTDAPITEVLPALMREGGYSFRSLATRTREIDTEERGVTYSYLAGLANGHEHPSLRALELLGAVFDVAPTYFAEYRLAQLRRELSEREVGFEAAYRRYRTLTHAA
ncbi:MAG: helix-turn-helix domain-containing protein [Actinomycetota bacterium]|nr:helix-turn-helix domain-containing protein [Actinomycetota bacterium]